ncbi:acyl-CoA dehydrogenase family protein, partial [Mycobacteroides abscessus]|uniref:acyl-CoA dehydrogenase family protein n=1 Tax=Mycobacteroides abscessus TaxID=36809 RepID=UPI0022A8E647
ARRIKRNGGRLKHPHPQVLTISQLHGGYGYMTEYPIGRMWADARVQKIYGGTNEIMKEIIARSL